MGNPPGSAPRVAPDRFPKPISMQPDASCPPATAAWPGTAGRPLPPTASCVPGSRKCRRRTGRTPDTRAAKFPKPKPVAGRSFTIATDEARNSRRPPKGCRSFMRRARSTCHPAMTVKNTATLAKTAKLRAATPPPAPPLHRRTSGSCRRAHPRLPPTRAWPQPWHNRPAPGGGRAGVPQRNRQHRFQERGILVPVNEQTNTKSE